MIKFLCFVDGAITTDIVHDFDAFVNDEGMGGQACGYVINASDGYSFNIRLADHLKDDRTKWNILTNQVELLSHTYCWNAAFAVPERGYVYDFKTGRFLNLQDLTEKELREAHNIVKMYISGAFNLYEQK